MLKKWMSALLAVILMVSMIPSTAVFAAAEDIVTITVVNEAGEIIDDATVTVTRNYTRSNRVRTQVVSVSKTTAGTYTYDTSRYTSGTTNYYTVSVERNGYTSVTQQVDPATRAVLITLTEYVEPENWQQFDVYYIATGIVPEEYTGAGDPADYGPSGNDVPLVTINVDISQLKRAIYADHVVYEENQSGNSYHFIPAGDVSGDSANIDDEQRTLIKEFWAAVWKCMDQESKDAFEATGLSDSFLGYVLKNQGSAQNPDNHCDGILLVEPPVYVVEMNDRGTYFGGFANDKETSQFTKLTDVLTAYNNHFKQNINWVPNGDGTYSGSYVEGKYQYYLKISQTNYGTTLYQPEVAQGDEYIQYKKQTDQYYLATFDAETVRVDQIEFTVTYQDGMNSKVFNAQVTPVKEGGAVPVFGGEVVRENYNHIGWMLEGGDGKVLSQEEILSTYGTVNSDLTFIAVYELKPATFAGVVEIVLNGSYENGVATGERVDITAMKEDTLSLAVSTDGMKFIPLDRTDTGVYSAHLENGTYYIYYFDGEGYERASEQQLDIVDAARTRYLFFNSVEYDLNGGQNGPDPLTEYHQTGAAVTVSTAVPQMEGYHFLGWQDQDGALHQSGAALTTAIGNAYKLTAQWEKIRYADVNVTVVINHQEKDGGINSDFDKTLEIDLTYRPLGSAEDYVEVVGKEAVKSDWYADGTSADNVTTVVYDALFEKLDVTQEYNANVFMTSYEVIDRTVTSTETDGNITYDVVVTLQFRPKQYMLQYAVEEQIDNDALVPQATDIKVLTWYNPSFETAGAPNQTMWYPIIQHVHSSHDVLFTETVDGNQVGYGSYSVWGWEDEDEGHPYYYRIGTVGFTLADGTELTAVTEDGVHFVSVASADGRYPAGAYTAKLQLNGGGTPDGTDLVGAYFDANGTQNGTLTLVIEAHPYTVTLDPNGGVMNGSDAAVEIDDQFVVPSLDGYVPARTDAYVFDRWVLLDENGNETEQTVTAGDALTRDITLVAAWKEPLTVEGLVTVGATYERITASGSSVQWIYEEDRPKTTTILLQKVDPNGYTETVRSETLTLDYTDKDYYYEVNRVVGVSTYKFENIPDDGTAYRIQMILPNYISLFQNEPDSVKRPLEYWEYDEESYMVDWGSAEPTVGTANIHNHFEPENFDLTYTVDASAIGEGFRPDSAEMLITADGVPSGYVPSEWAVISQMIINEQYVGNDVAIGENGIGHRTDPVWISRIDGTTYYQYGIRLYKVTTGDTTVEYTTDLPYTVTYEAPAHYHYGAQSEELKAILTPNTYDIRYELGGGQATGDYPVTHTWSHETALNLSDPVFAGFAFDGWYLDEAFTTPAPAAIAADVAADTTLYAKWVQVMDVVDLTVIVNHTQEGNDDGLAGNYDKTLRTQLTHDLRTNEGAIDRVYSDVEGYAKEYPNGIWHTHGDNVRQDVFQIPAYYTHLSAEYDYAVNVSLDGYYVTNKTVTKTAQPDGSTLHKVVVELQYNPELLTLGFYVRVDDEVTELPVSAEVKVTSWYDSPSAAVDWQWFRISQHETTTVTVTIDPATRRGEGSYPVWMWYDKEAKIPYHYRIEVLQLNLADGTSVPMTETTDDVMYHGSGYHAEIETEGGSVPNIPNISATTTLEGVYGMEQNNVYMQQGTVGAVIGRHDSVIFHANNADYAGADAFRTYYHHQMPDSYALNANNQVDMFYDIPTFDYTTHNNYIFKGWYMHPVSDAQPFDWNTVFEGSADVYAHWVTVGDVAKEEADSKIIKDGVYHEYDLAGVQIRDEDIDELEHYGDAGSGLRFVTSMSERVYNEINAVSGQQAEYGFVMAMTSTLLGKAGNDAGYMLQYKGANVNGVNTNSAYSYVQNVRCSGVADHYNGDTYRLYTAVITYKGLEGAQRDAAYATEFTARSYLRYTDANGLLRTYYNNYTGDAATAGGCTTSFSGVQGMMGE